MSFKAGFIGLLGLPNAGKSTVTNVLVGEKVSIVTSKPQTTRKRVVGLYTDSKVQALLVDAPGIVRSSSGLNQFLEKEYQDVVQQSDALLVVLNLDAKKAEDLDQVIEFAETSKKPWMGIINKSDLSLLHRSFILREKIQSLGKPYLVVSALKHPEDLKEAVTKFFAEVLPESPAPLYDTDLYTLSNTREVAAEIVREKAFDLLHFEIPFGMAVRIMKFDESQGNITKIFAEILVSKESHRSIVIGQNGQMLKSIGSAARKELEKVIGKKIFLNLHVSYKKNWVKNDRIMQELGYVLPEAHA